MPTVDDILGPASVDTILGPPPPGAFDWAHNAPEVAPSGTSANTSANTPQEQFLNTTRQGRVLDAVGQGLKDGWGTQPIGLSQETEKFLSGVGILPQAQNGILAPLRAFNEALIRPAAAAWDIGTRALNSATYGFASLVGANVGEAEGKKGMDWDAARDTLALAQTLGIVSGEGRVEVPTARSSFVPAAEAPITGPRSALTIADEHAAVVTSVETQAMKDVAAAHAPATSEAPAPPARPAVMAADRTDTPPQQPHTLYGPAESTVTDKAGNIRLDLLTDDESVKGVIRQAANENDDFRDMRRSVPTGLEPVERERIAEALGMSSEALNERAIGEAFTKGQIETARKMLVESANNVQDLARKAAADGATEADILAYAKAEQQHLMIQGGVARITHVWGEAGNAFKSLQAEVGEAQSVGDVIKNATGHSLDEVKARAASVRDMNDPNSVSRNIFDLAKPTAKDKFLEYWINGLLSGPATHSTYMISNAIFALWKAGLETPAAALVGMARKGGRVYMGETGAALHGIMQGAKDGILPAWQSMKTGQTASLPGETLVTGSPFTGAKRPAIGGVVGKVVRVPSNVIAGMHTLTRAVGYRQELNRLAYRQAAEEGLDGQDFATRVAQLTNDPTEAMMTDASTNATEQAFMGRLQSKFGAALETLANSNLAAKMVMPFVRVGSNIVNQALLERTPLGLFSSDIRANLSGANGKIAQDSQIAKMGVSAVAATVIAGLAVRGQITGAGPNEPTKAAMWRLAGNQPYSVKIGDSWYGYHRFGVLGLQMGAVASAYEVMHEATTDETANIGTLAMSSISKNILDESWFRGLSDLVQANDDPGRYGEKYISNMMASIVVPFSVGSGQVARMMDPEVRQIHGIVDTIKARVPGLSQTLPPRLDIWGQPIPNEGALGVATAIYQSRVNHDPVTQALMALNMHPAPPEATIKGAKLTPTEYDEYQKQAGILAHTMLDGMVTQDWWNDVPAFGRIELINHAIERSRKAAAVSLQITPGSDLIQRGIDNKLKQINGVEK